MKSRAKVLIQSAVRIALPATSANLGPAFDAAALAMNFYIKIEARAAEFDRLIESEEAKIPEFLEKLVRRKLTGRLPLVDMRIDLGGDEFL